MRSSAAKVPEARIVGIDISIDMRAASVRVKPALRAPVIVMPEREVPGIKATACQSPSTSASRHVKTSIFHVFWALWSTQYSKMPKMSIAQPITVIDLRVSDRPVSLKINPAKITGIVAITNTINSRAGGVLI
jgi:hypothetical protein